MQISIAINFDTETGQLKTDGKLNGIEDAPAEAQRFVLEMAISQLDRKMLAVEVVNTLAAAQQEAIQQAKVRQLIQR